MGYIATIIGNWSKAEKNTKHDIREVWQKESMYDV